MSDYDQLNSAAWAARSAAEREANASGLGWREVKAAGDAAAASVWAARPSPPSPPDNGRSTTGARLASRAAAEARLRAEQRARWDD